MDLELEYAPSMLFRQDFMAATSNDCLDLIFGRRSIRVYAPGPISEEIVAKILEAAMAAPSAMTKDPWRFVVIREKEMLSKMAGALPGGKMLTTAAVGIAVCGDREAALEGSLGYLLQDCAAATQNLLRGAHALGMGACWVGVHPREESVRQVKEFLSLPAFIIPIAVVALGHPGEQPAPR